MSESARIAVEPLTDGVRITIPSRKHILEILFEGILVLPFVASEILMLLRAIGMGDNRPYHWFGTLAWSVVGTLVFRRFAWVVFGEQLIVARRTELAICRQVRGTIRRSRKYKAAKIRSLRVLPKSNPLTGSVRLAFNYGLDIVTFGAEVSENEAHEILNQLKPTYPA
jgi:hypothetical protein